MIPSDLGCKRLKTLNDFSQPRPAIRPQSQVSDSLPLLPPQQHYGNIPPFCVPRIPVENSSHQPSNYGNQSSNLEFLQHINFSVPPPFPPVFPGPVSGALQLSCYPPNFNLPTSASLPGILNQCDPYEINEHCNEDDSLEAGEIIHHSQKKDERPQIQVHSFSEQLRNFHTSLLKLKNDLNNLNLVGNHLDSVSWNDRIASLSSQRTALKDLKRTMSVDLTSLSLLRYKMKKRLKKRKAKKKNLIETKSVSKYEIAYLHRQQLQQIVDKQKQEEKFKMEADSILFSVRQKKSEANGQIQFLTALSKLHTARINATNAQNKSYDAISGFNKIIDELKSMWQRQMEEYLIEENGLNMMLKDLAVTAEDLDTSKMKETCGQWLKLLFGTTNVEKGFCFSNYNELAAIRRDWDKYVVYDEKNSSKIPAGWVVPKHPRDDAWSQFVS